MVWATYLHVFLWIFHRIIIIISWKLCIDQLHTCSQFDTTTYNYCFSSSILFNLRPISNLRERRISNLLFNTKIDAFVRSIKVDLTKLFLMFHEVPPKIWRNSGNIGLLNHKLAQSRYHQSLPKDACSFMNLESMFLMEFGWYIHCFDHNFAFSKSFPRLPKPA